VVINNDVLGKQLFPLRISGSWRLQIASYHLDTHPSWASLRPSNSIQDKIVNPLLDDLANRKIYIKHL